MKFLHFSGPAQLPTFSGFVFPGVQCDARWEQGKVLRDPLLVPLTMEPISRCLGDTVISVCRVYWVLSGTTLRQWSNEIVYLFIYINYLFRK